MPTINEKVEELEEDLFPNTYPEECRSRYELVGNDLISAEENFKDVMTQLARFVFNQMYFHEASNEVEPWGTEEQRHDQEMFANGWNAYREDVKDKAKLLGIIKDTPPHINK